MFLRPFSLVLFAVGGAVSLAVDLRYGLWLWLLCWLILVGIDAVFAPGKEKFTVTRTAPPRIRRGESAETLVKVGNRTTRPVRLQLHDQWPPSARVKQGSRESLNLGPRGQIQLINSISPQRRGILTSGGVSLRTFGPLGLAGRQFTYHLATQLLVLPAFTSRSHLPMLVRSLYAVTGQQRTMSRGAGSEFDSLREYVPGDDVRDLDWRASARANVPMVRTWRPEAAEEILILNDYGRAGAGRLGDLTRFEYQVECALLLGALATRAGDQVRYAQIAQQVTMSQSRSTESALLGAIAQQAAQTELTLAPTDFALAVPLATRTLRRSSLVIVFTALDTSALDSGLLPMCLALRRKHRVAVIGINPDTTTTTETRISDVAQLQSKTKTDAREQTRDLLADAADQQTELETQRLLLNLRNLGIQAVIASSTEAPAVAGRLYLQSKIER